MRTEAAVDNTITTSSLVFSCCQCNITIILVNGQYAFNLPSGLYRITVAYPDGKNQIIDNYAVWPGSDTSLDLGY
jgi:hypothetical protein